MNFGRDKKHDTKKNNDRKERKRHEIKSKKQEAKNTLQIRLSRFVLPIDAMRGVLSKDSAS